jgi:hypothetical protein
MSSIPGDPEQTPGVEIHPKHSATGMRLRLRTVRLFASPHETTSTRRPGNERRRSAATERIAFDHGPTPPVRRAASTSCRFARIAAEA